MNSNKSTKAAPATKNNNKNNNKHHINDDGTIDFKRMHNI